MVNIAGQLRRKHGWFSSQLAANIPSQGLMYAMAHSVNYTDDQYEARYSKI
jgi:hypothetical protein